MSDTLASCESVSLGKLVLRLDRNGAFAREISVGGEELFRGRRQSNSIRRRVARHARSQATIYAARARHSVNAIERLCL